MTILPSSPYLDFLGVETREDEGDLICVLPFADHLVGNVALPALHGGAVGAFLETCAILELLRAHGERQGAYPKTISFTIQYLRSGRPKTTFAQAKVTKLGRRVSNVFVEAWQSERERPIATAQGQFLKP
ncbi:MAG: PaaI family thioesterase [Acidobacteriota bacterium]